MKHASPTFVPSRFVSHPSNHHWLSDVYLWLPLALASWWLAYGLRDPFISDWDGFDYTVNGWTGLYPKE